MKKFFKLGKRMLALFIVVLLNINSYAAVGANDGSAFVTKAEFDALVNTFNEQMDTYQSGLNAKIDGAISNYLAGLSSVTTEKLFIMLNGWDRVYAFNGVVDPTFSLPGVNVYYGGGMNGTYNRGTEGNVRFTIAFNRRYINDASNNIRPMLSCNKGEADTSRTFYWSGVATDYQEKYSCNVSLFYNNSTTDIPGIDAISDTTVGFIDGVCYRVSDGYNGTFGTSTSVLQPKVNIGDGTYGYAREVNFNSKTASNVAEIKYTNTKYDHIISYNKEDKWCVSVPTWTHTFRTHADNNKRSKELGNACSLQGEGSSTSYKYREGSGVVAFRGKSLSIIESTTTFSDLVLPSVGMIQRDFATKEIVLTKDDIKYTEKGQEKILEKSTLEKGFPLFYAEKDAKITWKPYFVKGEAKTSTGAWIDSTASRVKLYLSAGPFSDKLVTNNLIAAESTDGKGTDGCVYSAIGAEDGSTEVASITFKMPKDSIVYAKWVPDTSTFDTEGWAQPLDVSYCSSYTLRTE